MPAILLAFLPYAKILAVLGGGFWLLDKTGDAFKAIGELALIGGVGWLIAKAQRWI
jgi:hypothetical protein